jgi:hypothetical protein
MYKDPIDQQMSEMEREFELEMDNDFEFEMENSDEEFEDTDYESDDEFEFEDYEDEPQSEFEWSGGNSDYGERFYELSQREFESETEVDEAVDRLLTEMENEFFWGGILKKAKNAAMGLAKKGMALAKKAGINLPSLDALKSMLGPLSGLLKGNLGALIKPALKAALAAHPAGAALLPALKGLGFETGEDMDGNREAYNRYADVAREAFESLAESVNQNADNPLEASRLATNAFQKSLRKHQIRRDHRTIVGGGRGKKRVRRIYAAPGEVIVVIQRKR